MAARPHEDRNANWRKAGVRLLAVTVIGIVLGTPGASAVVLDIDYDTSARPILPGDTINVKVNMENVAPSEAAGFQAFLEFEDDEMTFIGGTYTSDPFGLAILPVVANGETIDLAAGINTFNDQQPTSADATLVEMTFQATAEFCTPTVHFRTNAPPTRVTDDQGNAITPLNLRSLEPPDCLGDIAPETGNGVVNVFDLLKLLEQWGAPVPSSADIAPDQCDAEVNVFDLLQLLENWGPCD